MRLDGQEAVRFLPVEWINNPSIIARNRNRRSINGALMLDLAGQVVADTIDGRQHSGIGGHEDFTFRRARLSRQPGQPRRAGGR